MDGDLVAKFLESLTRTSQPATRRAYRLALAHFEAFLIGSGRSLPATTQSDIAAFVGDQLAAGVAARSVQLRLSAVRALGKWLVRRQVWTTNHAMSTPSVPDSMTPTHTVDSGALDLLVERGPDPDGGNYSRDLVLVLLVARLGLKSGEIERLTWDHVDLERAVMKVDGGPRRGVRDLSLTAEVADALRRHRQTRAFGPVIARGSGASLPSRDLRRLLSSLADHAGLAKMNFSAARYAVLKDAMEPGVRLANHQSNHGYAHPSHVLRAAGRFSKG